MSHERRHNRDWLKKPCLEREHTSRGLLVIAAFKLLKGLALLAVGIGAHTLINKDFAAILEH